MLERPASDVTCLSIPWHRSTLGIVFVLLWKFAVESSIYRADNEDELQVIARHATTWDSLVNPRLWFIHRSAAFFNAHLCISESKQISIAAALFSKRRSGTTASKRLLLFDLQLILHVLHLASIRGFYATEKPCSSSCVLVFSHDVTSFNISVVHKTQGRFLGHREATHGE